MVLSNYENKIDKKGRVSVPATFRSHLGSMGYNGFISYPSFNHPALEACAQDRIEKLTNTSQDKKETCCTTSMLVCWRTKKDINNVLSSYTRSVEFRTIVEILENMHKAESEQIKVIEDISEYNSEEINIIKKNFPKQNLYY